MLNIKHFQINFVSRIFNFYFQVSKLILDEYFASREFVSGTEDTGTEFALLNSSASTIPASHQLNSTSPFVDSGVGLNVLDKYGRIAEQASIENDDDVFVVEDDGKLAVCS